MSDAASERVAELVARLSLEEKASLVAGADMWTTPGAPRLGIPGLKLTDGPNGARGLDVPGAGLRAACFPCGSALGATWSPELVERVGAALGEEARSKGAHVLLAPTVNIHRSPLAGRNFECYAEDPLLSRRLAVACVRGVQSRGVSACAKHFVCNDSEFERHTISSEVDERALREIYLPPFEAAVREARVGAVMGAYNKVNGTWACEHPRLLTGILRREWGFEGFVVSDWFATRSTAAAAEAGLDLEMPGPPRRFGEPLLAAVRGGEVAEATLDAMAGRILGVMERIGALDREDEPQRAVDRPEHRAVAREAAAESIVLLRNEEGVLPLDPDALRRLAVIGPNAAAAVFQGGGSAQVTPHYVVSALEGIRARLGETVEVRHERGCARHRTSPVLDATRLAPREDGEPLRVEIFADDAPGGAPLHVTSARRAELAWFGEPAPGVPADRYAVRLLGHLEVPESGLYTLSLASAGRSRLLVDGALVVDNWEPAPGGESFFGAGSPEVQGRVPLEAGRRAELCVEFAKQSPRSPLAGLRVGCVLPDPDDLMERAVRCAADADAAVVVVGLDAEWETEGRDRVDLSLPRRQDELVRRVTAANPRTVVVLNAGSPLAMPWRDQVPAILQLWYPGQELGNALADVLFGDADPAGRLPLTFPARLEDSPSFPWYPGEDGEARYGEGVFVGYRGYDASGTEPLFPFGHGLSYGRLEYGALCPETGEIGPGDALHASVEVTNAGTRPAREVVQLYLRDEASSVPRPPRELVDFAKLSLAPGETRRVSLRVEPRAVGVWDAGRAAWRAEPGAFELAVGRSSRDLRATARFVLNG